MPLSAPALALLGKLGRPVELPRRLGSRAVENFDDLRPVHQRRARRPVLLL